MPLFGVHFLDALLFRAHMYKYSFKVTFPSLFMSCCLMNAAPKSWSSIVMVPSLEWSLARKISVHTFCETVPRTEMGSYRYGG